MTRSPIVLSGVLVLSLVSALLGQTSAVSAEPQSRAPSRARFDYTRPAAPRDVAGGSFLGVVGAGLRLIRVENPSGPVGCEGAPAPDLRAVTAGGGSGDLFDPAPAITLSAGGNQVFSAGHHVAIVTFCEGFLDQVWLAKAFGKRLVRVRALPTLDPRPVGPLLVTALSHDGRRLLAVHTGDSTLEGHRILAIDTGSGAVTDLGVRGFWAGELANGTLVVDQGAQLRIGDETIAVPDVPDAGRFVAISPDGRRIAWANLTGLYVVKRDGSLRQWSSEPVLGRPAWSPDNAALAYATGPVDAISGELHIVTAKSAPLSVNPAVMVFTPVAFANDRTVAALLATAVGSDPTDPGTGRVSEVTFPRTR